MRERRGEMPAELVELDQPVVEVGDRVAGGGAAVGIDEDDAVVAGIGRVGLRVDPAGHGVVGDGHAAGIAGEDDNAAGAAGGP